MGTRSKTNVYDANSKVIISLYRQFDGDLQTDHHADNLKEFLTKNRLSKEINKCETCPEFNRGMEDLAGNLFIFLKTKTKYIMPAYAPNNVDWEYEYEIRFNSKDSSGKKLSIKYRNWENYGISDWKDLDY